jgi:ganglioside-induced differentiation-associated protein 1
MLDLYHHGSSACAAKVRFALEEKHIQWNGHVVDILRGEQFKLDFLALNPKAVVPVLVHDGLVIPESTVICEYLEEAFAQRPIFPLTPKARAQVRLWTKAVDEELHPACSAVTYIVSHRHTILRNGTGTFEDFMNGSGAGGIAARKQKWEWIQRGIDAPGALDKIRLYDAYLHKMEQALRESPWLVEDQFSMADIAMTPYVNRMAALSMQEMWTHGRLPRVQEWFERVRARPTFDPAFVRWMPQSLATEMRQNGEQSWPKIREVLEIK